MSVKIGEIYAFEKDEHWRVLGGPSWPEYTDLKCVKTNEKRRTNIGEISRHYSVAVISSHIWAKVTSNYPKEAV